MQALDIRDAIRNVHLKYKPNSVVPPSEIRLDMLIETIRYIAVIIFPNCEINQILKLLKTNRLNFCNYQTNLFHKP